MAEGLEGGGGWKRVVPGWVLPEGVGSEGARGICFGEYEGAEEDAFDLGRFEMPVAIGALVWSVLVVSVLVSPPEALTAVLIAVGVVLAGGAYLAYLFISNREVLETEPGAMDVFKH